MEIVDTEIGKHTDKRTSSTFTISGTKMNLNVACPGTAALSFDFSATATTYSMWGANDNKIHVHTKQ